MLFIGLVWMLSFWSGFLSSSQGLLDAPDSSFNTLPAKRWPTVGSPEKSRFSFSRLPLTLGVGGLPSTPTFALSLNWGLNLGRSQGKPKRVKSFVRSLTSSVPADNVLCQTHSKPTNQLIRFVQPTPQHPASFDLELPNRAEQNIQPRKNAGLLPNFVPWYLSKFDSSSSASEPTVVVRSKSDDPADRDDRAKVGYLKLLNFWHPSQSKSNRASAKKPPTNQNSFQIWVKGYLIAEIPDRAEAQLMGDRLEQFLKQPGWEPSQLQLSLVKETVELKAGDRLLVAIDDNLAATFNRHRELLAIDWLNNLRIALGTTPLSLVEAQIQMHGLVETGGQIEGPASWYGPYFHGRLTATGEIYDQNDFTAAHPSLPFDTYLKVTNLNNGKSAIVRVNDRGPYVDDRALDLSHGAALCLNSIDAGVVPVRAVLMQPTSANKRPLSGQRLAGS